MRVFMTSVEFSELMLASPWLQQVLAGASSDLLLSKADNSLELGDHDLDRLLERGARSDGAVGLDRDAQGG
jgi:hypothetical protein